MDGLTSDSGFIAKINMPHVLVHFTSCLGIAFKSGPSTLEVQEGFKQRLISWTEAEPMSADAVQAAGSPRILLMDPATCAISDGLKARRARPASQA